MIQDSRIYKSNNNHNWKVKVTQSCLTLWPCGLYSPWNSPSQNTGVGSLSLLQGIFPIQGLNPGALHCRQILYQLSHKGSPRKLEWVAYPFSRGSSWPRNQTRVSCIWGRFFINWAIKEAQCRSSRKMGFLWRLHYIVMIDQISVGQALNHY